MATKTLYLTATTTSTFGTLSESAPAASTTAHGWIIGTNAVGNFKIMLWGTEQARTGWSTTDPVTSSNSPGSGNALVTANSYSGEFAAGNWTLSFTFRPVSAVSASAKPVISYAIWRGPNQNGSGASFVAQSVTNAGTGTLSATTTDYTTSGTITLPSLTFNNEYIFIVISMKTNGAAGSGNTADADWRITGTTTNAIITTDFAPATYVSTTGVSASGAVGTITPQPVNPSVTYPVNFTTGSLPQYVTATGATNGTIVDSSGYVTYANHNLLLNSDDFTNAPGGAWTNTASIITYKTIADPNGGTNGASITATAQYQGFYQTISLVAGRTYCISAWVKCASGTIAAGNVVIQASDGTNFNTHFGMDITTSWQRFSYVFTAQTTGSWTFAAQDNRASGWTTWHVYGAQLEMVTYETSARSYVTTTSAAKWAARFTCDPITHAYTGILNEPSVTNLVTNSDQPFGTPTNATITTTTVTAPDGQNDAALWTRSSTSSAFSSLASITPSGQSPYTFSVFVKKSVGNYFSLLLNSTGTNVNAVFDINSGTIVSCWVNNGTGGTTSFLMPSWHITAYQNGWYRVGLTAVTASSASFTPSIGFSSNAIQVGGTDSASNSAGYIWGVMVGQSPFMSSYVSSGASATTRSADSISLLNGLATKIEYIFDGDYQDQFVATNSSVTIPTTLDGLMIKSIIDSSSKNKKPAIGRYRIRPYTPASSQATTTVDGWICGSSTSVAKSVDQIAPDGTYTSTNIFVPSFGAGTGVRTLTQTYTSSDVVVGTNYTFSFYAKAGTNCNYVGVDFFDGNSNESWWNLSTGAVKSSATGRTLAIYPAKNGWYFCSITAQFVTPLPANPAMKFLVSADAQRFTSTSMAAGDGVYVWGAKLEPTSIATNNDYSDSTLLDLPTAPAFYVDVQRSDSVNFATANTVGSLTDVSVNGRTLGVPNGPVTYDPVGLGGKPSLNTADGNWRYFKATPPVTNLPSGSEAHTWVLYCDGGGMSDYVANMNYGSDRSFGSLGGGPAILHTGSDRSGTVPWNSNGNLVVWTLAAGASPATELWVDGALSYSGSTGTYSTSLTVNGISFGNNDNNVTVNKVALLAIYAGVLSTEERQKAEGIVMWARGQQSRLPADHPYKTAAPANYTTSTAVDVPLTGVSASGTVGVSSPSFDKSISLTGLAATSSIGTVSVTIATTTQVSIAGLPVTGSVGSITTTSSVSKSLTSVAATSSIGSTIASTTLSLAGLSTPSAVGLVTASNSKSLTGLTATSALGSTSIRVDDSLTLTGLQVASSVGATSARIDVTITLTGLSASGSVGATAPNASSTLNGLTATTAVGDISVGSARSISITGLAATTATGTTTIAVNDTSTLIGLQATASLGNLVAQNSKPLTGIQATSAIGSVTPLVAPLIFMGVSATGFVGSTSITSTIILSSVNTTGAVGSTTVFSGSSASVNLTGVSASGTVGTTSVATSEFMTGLQASGSVGATVASPSVSLGGIQAATNIGSVSTKSDASKSISGLQATTAIGSTTIQVNDSVTLTGLVAASSLGSVSVMKVTSVSLAGLSAASSVGPISATNNIALAGLSAASALGLVTPTISAAMAGVAATSAVGSVSVTKLTTTTLTGLSAASALGAIGFDSKANLAGVTALGSVGTIVPQNNTSKTVAAQAVTATTSVGSVTFSFIQNVSITGVGATGAVAPVMVALQNPLTGVSATGSVGSIVGSPCPVLTGVTATGSVGAVNKSLAVSVSGVQATGASGSVQAAVSVSITGVGGITVIGSVSKSLGPAIDGIQATGLVGSLAFSMAVPITGLQATGRASNLQASGLAPIGGAPMMMI